MFLYIKGGSCHLRTCGGQLSGDVAESYSRHFFFGKS